VRIVFLGPPGSGKGTQAKALAESLGVPMISTGEILRGAVRAATPLGLKARATMESGGLVPDDLIVALVRERLDQPDARRGFILDGFPRTAQQAKELDQILSSGSADSGLTAVINLRVPEDVLVGRLRGRAGQENRADDHPEAVTERLRVYEEKTAPLIGFYRGRGLLLEIDGLGDIGEIGERIVRALSASGARKKERGSALDVKTPGVVA
jgi:adenylate kinase